MLSRRAPMNAMIFDRIIRNIRSQTIATPTPKAKNASVGSDPVATTLSYTAITNSGVTSARIFSTNVIPRV